MKELLKRTEPFKNHIQHNGNGDPNYYIFHQYKDNGLEEKAEKFYKYREAWEKARTSPEVSPHPLHISFAFQNSCNLECPHCYRQYNPNQYAQSVLPHEKILQMIDECKAIGVPSIQLGAGIETFLYPKINEVIEYIGKKGFEDFWIGTNGLRLTPERCDLILDSNVTRLEVSMDAITPQTYAKSRGGDFYALFKNVFTFLEKRNKRKLKLPMFRVSLVRYNLTKHEEEGFLNFWKPIADEVDVQPLIDVKNVNKLQYESIDPEKIHCKYPTNMMWIDWNGDYRPCCVDFSNLVQVGNIKDMGILEAWMCEKMRDLRDQLNRKKKLNKACVNCLRSMHSNEVYEVLPIKGS